MAHLGETQVWAVLKLVPDESGQRTEKSAPLPGDRRSHAWR